MARPITLDLHIRFITILINKDTNLLVEWTRGTKTAKTKFRQVKAQQNQQLVKIDDRFQLQSVLSVNPKGEFEPKVSRLRVTTKEGSILGQVDIDISKFVDDRHNSIEKSLKLTLENCEDKAATIEVKIGIILGMAPKPVETKVDAKNEKKSGVI